MSLVLVHNTSLHLSTSVKHASQLSFRTSETKLDFRQYSYIQRVLDLRNTSNEQGTA